MWISFIKSLCAETEFNQPALLSDIINVETKLKCQFPDDLKKCLFESNGIRGEYGIGLIWDNNRICEDNIKFRRNVDFKELYMPFDNFLFFADAGNGDQFAYSILNGKITRNDIFVWNHENDSRTWVAPNLSKYLEWWLSGIIKV